MMLCVLAATAVAQAAEYEPGVAAHYYKDATNWNGLWPSDTDAPLADPKTCTFTEFKYTQIEPVVNHLFTRSGWFSVRWVGYIDVPGDDNELNAFILELWADDGCRLQIDDDVLINSWYACPEDIDEARRKASASLKPGKHRIIIEYFQGQSLEAGGRRAGGLHAGRESTDAPGRRGMPRRPQTAGRTPVSRGGVDAEEWEGLDRPRVPGQR